jgi:hypothetical protein
VRIGLAAELKGITDISHTNRRVRVVKVPDLSGMRPRGRRESRAVFEHIIGTYKRVVAFNSLGWPELSFRILNGPYSGLHSVWIEPDLLRVRRTRS